MKKVLPVKISRKKSAVFLFLTIVLVSIAFFAGTTEVQASPVAEAAESVGKSIGSWLTSAFMGMSEFFIKMAIFFLQYFIAIAGWNEYLDVNTVMLGWTMVRDVANMFFVIILLVIAFGTILGIEQYQWNKTLVKLILAAVFINFSNLICGIFIDAAHVFTITFVNAVSATAGGNFIQAFKLQELFGLVTGEKVPGNIEFDIRLFVASIASLIFAIMAMIIMAVYAMIMLARMVVLWVLIILSPLAFIFQVLPGTQSYAKQWWDKFMKQVLVAPVMVFFLWLTFATAGSGGVADEINLKLRHEAGATFKASETDDVAVSLNQATTWGNMASFFIPLALMIVGMGVVTQMGVVGGGLVQSGQAFAKKIAGYATGYNAAKWGAGKAWQGTKATAKWGAMNAPIVGGKSWQRRGAFIHEKGLAAGEKWNQTIGAVTGVQFGKHKRIMELRKKAIEQRQGRLGSSAKGSILLGKPVGRLRDYKDRLEGEGKERAARSAAGSAVRQNVAATKLRKEGREGFFGKKGSWGEEAARRDMRKDTSQSELSTVQVQGKVDILASDNDISKKYVDAQLEDRTVRDTWTTINTAKVKDLDTKKIAKGKERVKEEEEAERLNTTSDQAVVQNYEAQQAVAEDNAPVENAEAAVRDSEEKLFGSKEKKEQFEKDEQEHRKKAKVERDAAKAKEIEIAEVTAEKAKILSGGGLATSPDYEALNEKQEKLEKEKEQHENNATELEEKADEAKKAADEAGEGTLGTEESKLLAELQKIADTTAKTAQNTANGLRTEAGKERSKAETMKTELGGVEKELKDKRKANDMGLPVDLNDVGNLQKKATTLRTGIEGHEQKAIELDKQAKEEEKKATTATTSTDMTKVEGLLEYIANGIKVVADNTAGNLRVQANEQRGEAETKKVKLDEVEKRINDELKNLQTGAPVDYNKIEGLKKQATTLKTEIGEHEENAIQLDEQAKEEEKKSGSDSSAGMKKVEDILEKINEAIKKGEKDKAIVDIKKDPELGPLFNQLNTMLGDRLEKGEDTDKLLSVLKDGRDLQEAKKIIDDKKAERAKAQDFVNNPVNVQRKMEAQEKIDNIPKVAWTRVAQSGENTQFRLAYEKVKLDGQSTPLNQIATTRMNEGMMQAVMDDRRHAKTPPSALSSEINKMSARLDMELDILIPAYKKLVADIARRRQEDPNYADSPEGKMDNLYQLGFMSQIHDKKYVDDLTGSAEKINTSEKREAHIIKIGKQAASDMGTDWDTDEDFRKNFIATANRKIDAKKNRGGVVKINVEAKLSEINNDNTKGRQLADVFEGLGDTGTRIKDGRELSDSDFSTIETVFRQYMSNNSNVSSNNLSSLEEMKAILKKAATDSTTRDSLSNVIDRHKKQS